MNEVKEKDESLTATHPTDYVRREVEFLSQMEEKPVGQTSHTGKPEQWTILLISEKELLLKDLVTTLQLELGEKALVVSGTTYGDMIRALSLYQINLMIIGSLKKTEEEIKAEFRPSLNKGVEVLIPDNDDGEFKKWLTQDAVSSKIMKAVTQLVSL